jgi:asparagine synthase (glutamine-hydrolysing)
VRRFVDQSELPVEQAWRHSRSIFSDSELGQLYTPDFASRVELAERGFQLRDAFLNFGAGAPDMEILNHVDYESYLPGDILVKVDRMSMANSIEMRAPLLDYRVAEFAASLPREWKWTRRSGKRILKRAARSIVPPSVLGRRKQGFVLPIDSWFRGELQPYLKERLASSRPNPIVRAEYCMQLMERHAHGEPGGIERKLWSILCFLLWYEKFAA